jgi:hypothetical protein
MSGTQPRRCARTLLNRRLWFGVMVMTSLVVGATTGAIAGSEGSTQDSCKALSCSPTKFAWGNATRTGGQVAIAVFVVACLIAIAVHAFLRFAEGPPRTERE